MIALLVPLFLNHMISSSTSIWRIYDLKSRDARCGANERLHVGGWQLWLSHLVFIMPNLFDPLFKIKTIITDRCLPCRQKSEKGKWKKKKEKAAMQPVIMADWRRPRLRPALMCANNRAPLSRHRKVTTLTHFSCSNGTFGCSLNRDVLNQNGVCG